MIWDTRIAAFIEYTMRPLTEDVRLILEQLKSLNIGITQDTIKSTVFALGLWHLVGEVIRGVTYILVTLVICDAVVRVWPALSRP